MNKLMNEALHIMIAQKVFINELLLLIDYDRDMNQKRKYDGYIKSKQEELANTSKRIDSFALQIPQGE